MSPWAWYAAAIALMLVAGAGCTTPPADNTTTDDTSASTAPTGNETTEPVEVGTVSIDAGIPASDLFPDQSPGESLPVTDHQGKTLYTTTVDNGGHGYDIDLYLYDGDGAQMHACAEIGDEETGCKVPTGAAEVKVVAWFGVDLEVTVWAE